MKAGRFQHYINRFISKHYFRRFGRELSVQKLSDSFYAIFYKEENSYISTEICRIDAESDYEKGRWCIYLHLDFWFAHKQYRMSIREKFKEVVKSLVIQLKTQFEIPLLYNQLQEGSPQVTDRQRTAVLLDAKTTNNSYLLHF